MTLGAYGVLTVAEARGQARETLAKIRLCQDPQAEAIARRAAEAAQASVLTVAKLVEQYIAAVRAGTAASKRLRGRQASLGYVEDTVLHLNRFATAYGTQDAGSVTRGDVVRLLNSYIRQPSTHRRMHGAISRMYAWAQRNELVSNAPADHIETTSQPSRERVLSLAELARVWWAAANLEPLYSDTVQLMVTTGQRRAEVAGMTWGEIDLARGLWTLPAARTKARRQHVLPLPPLAVAVLQRRRAAFQHAPAADDLVLPSWRATKGIAPISGWNWLKRELDRTSGVIMAAARFPPQHRDDLCRARRRCRGAGLHAQPRQLGHAWRRDRHLSARDADRADAQGHGAVGRAAARGDWTAARGVERTASGIGGLTPTPLLAALAWWCRNPAGHVALPRAARRRHIAAP